MDVVGINNDIVQKFKEDGFALIPEFLKTNEVQQLKDATKYLVREYCESAPVSIFSAKGDAADVNTTQVRDTYFAESGDKIRGFFEEQGVDETGKLVTPDVEEALNKIGHALHKFNPDFNSLTFSSKVKHVVQKFTNIKTPTVTQSMVIFKQPKIGGVVTPHQDASFLFMEPVEGNLIGFWIALDEATLENGCLHFLPGSHKGGKLYQRFVRNPDRNSSQLFVFIGDKVPSSPKEELIAVPAKPGDLILIDGLVIHQSDPNTSTKSRLAYTFHILEGDAKYSPKNWLQPTDQNTFMKFPLD